jgi:N-acetylneuraminic acid mutarotase
VPLKTIPALAAALCLASAARAGELVLTRSGGVLGEPLSYALQGDALELFFLVPSVSQGPLPVSLFCPGDPRVIQVGTELMTLAASGALSAGGAGLKVYPLPPDPGFQGVPLYAQAMTLFGPGCLIGDLSAQNGCTLAQHDTVHDTIGLCAKARQGHTATPVAGGKVLVAGGDEPDTAGVLTPLDSLELYDPQTQRFTLLPAHLAHPRSTQTATLLSDGRVLLAGGYDASQTVVATAEIYDPTTGAVAPAAPMSVARTQHTATLLADGRVFVAGGSSKFDLSDVLGSLAQVNRKAEIYDPVTNTWTPAPDVPIPGSVKGLVGHAASRLGNGQVLVTGGVEVTIIFGIPIPAITGRCYRYQPSTNSWVATASLAIDRVYHGQLTLADGTAVVAGGADGDFVLLNFFTLASCARYDAATNSWTALGSLQHPRAYPNVLHAGSEVVVAGGLSTVDVTSGSGAPEQAIEVSSGALAAWSTAASTALPRQVARAVAVDDGARVLIVGTGDDGVPAVDRTAEVYVR